jgi:hypothetical protein
MTDKGCCRFQFLEFLVKVAEYKFIKTENTKSYYEAMKRLYDEHLKETLDKFDVQEFRD